MGAFSVAQRQIGGYNESRKKQNMQQYIYAEVDAIMYDNGKIYLGLSGEERVELPLSMCNRHGLIAGATGTGKTVTMKVLAESLSDAGVPVFLCDVKGDVAGICAPGADSEDMQKRIERFGLTGKFAYRGYPTTFWDIYQTGGHAVRATVSEMGPELLSRILGLSEAQTGVLQIVFRVADDRGLLLDDLKDLRALLNYVNDHKEDYRMKYGNITTQSVAAILRALLPLEKEGGELFFGEPALDVNDWIRTDAEGRGMVNVLDCVKLVQNPTLYASFLLWLLSELFETMPEVGDLEKPKLVFFFDEAHMLFRDAPAVLVQKIEQTVKLIRSRGIGVFFVTQSPADVPNTVLAQLSNRVQHALRAYTPTELKAVRVAAQAFRENPAFNAEDAIMELGVGEALTSFLGEDGIPAMVQRTKIICPQSLMGAPEAMTRAKAILRDGMEKYDEAEDNVSAYEVLADETQAAEEALAQERERLEEEKRAAEEEKQRRKQAEADEKRAQKLEDEARRRAQKLEDEERRRAQRLEDEARRKAERAKQNELDRKYYNPPTAEYKRLRRLWWVVLIAAVIMVALSWFARSWEPAWISYVTLGSSYVLIILAFYLDFSKIRKCRRKYQMEMESQNTKESRRAEKAKRAAEREAEKQKEDAAAEVAEEQIKPKRGLFGRKKVDAADAAKPADAASAAKSADK